jgi:electron transfer flavoprotein alpha subunit
MSERVIVVLALQGRSDLSAAAREALAAGAEFAARTNGQLDCALLRGQAGSLPAQLDEFPLDNVLLVDDERLENINGEIITAATVSCVSQARADLVLLTRDAWNLEIAPRAAVRLNGASVTGVTDVEFPDDGTLLVEAMAYGGAARATYELSATGPSVLGLAARRTSGERAGNATPTITHISIPQDVVERVQIIGRSPRSGPRLEDARIVVAGGRGLGDAESFELVRTLAGLMGGMPGASRAIVDNGWADPSQQVGLTGALVAPNLYIAAGISGASQHMVGCSNARTIVAINTDPGAAIFNYARFGIVDDCRAVLAELILIASADGERG